MQQVADWLEKFGLGQYAKSSAENDISFSVLSDPTDQDHKDIGVSLGHRRQLLCEIAKLGQTIAAPESAPSVTARPIAAPTVAPHADVTGERRQPACCVRRNPPQEKLVGLCHGCPLRQRRAYNAACRNSFSKAAASLRTLANVTGASAFVAQSAH
jgi:hypothetical protein